MLRHFIEKYYIFFDEKLKSSTFVVLFIVGIIFTVGSVNAMNSQYMKASVLDMKNSQTFQNPGINTVTIDGVEYELIFSKIN